MFLSLVILKYLCFPAAFREDMDDPVLAGVAGIFTIAQVILSTYLKPLTAILLHGSTLEITS